MKQELQNKIFEKYPKIFRQKDLPMNETCMCWGLECGDGWYDVIDKLCEKIQNYIDQNGLDQIEAEQVKEKYGTLRFYTNYHDDTVEEFIAQAEQQTYNICELCGSTENIKPTTGWISYQCEKCRNLNK